MDSVRVDKWLWAARFFKTRSLAAKEVGAGHVTLSGTRIKPARLLRVGDILTIRAGYDTYTVRICALSERRGPASVARQLYEESTESVDRREQQAAERQLARSLETQPARRPDKRNRRKIRQFLKKE
ncbi:MAG: RNA-binding protein [Desulfobulbaceae bacterium]|nr:RNA-binding protein [Desulfobulbaceae bacterium]